MKLKWNKNYFLAFVLIFSIEVGIAIFVHDTFIRPYFGDFLVVFLVYFFVKFFFKSSKYTIAFGSFLFCCFVEVLQLFKIAEIIGFTDNKIVAVVLGTSFSWEDIAMYFLGFLVLIFLERFGVLK
jgi:hypothetical protein